MVIHRYYRALNLKLLLADQLADLSKVWEIHIAKLKEALDYPGYHINVQDFADLAVGADWTKAVKQAIYVATLKVTYPYAATPCEQRGAVVYFPPGTYEITQPLRIARHWIKVIGAGPFVTKIVFKPTDHTPTPPPTAEDGTPIPVKAWEPQPAPESRTLFLFRRSSACHPHNILYGCELKGLTILGSCDADDPVEVTELDKTAIHLVDVSGMVVEDVQVHNRFRGLKSIALRIQGRDTTTINRVALTTGFPIVIERNPNAVAVKELEDDPNADPSNTYDADHFHFKDCYTITTNPDAYAVSILSGYIHALTFDGYQAWCEGRGGLLWYDKDSPGYANQVVIRNVRLEQTSDAPPSDCIAPEPDSGWFAFIKPSGPLVGLIIENITGQGTTYPTQKDSWKIDENCSAAEWAIRNGIYVEGVNQISIRQVDFSGMRAPRWYDHGTLVFKAPPQAIRLGPICSAITLENIYHAEGCITDNAQGPTVSKYHRLAWLPSHLIAEDPKTKHLTASALAWAKLESGVDPGILQATWYKGDARYGGAIQQGHVSRNRGDTSVELVYGVDAETQRFT
ncbi:MAG: glycoside hydrolase family 55 protein, partial [Anaerolineae bacterium]|nr:glycoside hydrolase family 55 protein [Anaerolineae bacterium]